MSDNTTTPAKFDLTGDIMAFEDGQLEYDDIIILFQNLINSGLAWQLQGSYGHTAARLIEQGLCVRA